jgi:hypothetical protein
MTVDLELTSNYDRSISRTGTANISRKLKAADVQKKIYIFFNV